MKFSRLIALFMIILLVNIPAAAQDGYPLPENLPPITPENAAQVTELGRVGGVLPGDLVWSPDGTILAAGTSAGVKLYNADDLTSDPLQLSGSIPILIEKILVDLTLRTQQMTIKEQEFICASGCVHKFAGP